MSNSNDVNEQSGSPRDSRNPGNTDGMTCTSQVPNPVAVRVDQKDLVGGKDTRDNDSADFSMESFQRQAGPRGLTTKDPNAGA
ncbi:MAG: hypothetical protein WCC22_20820 [Terriglobales bacterium]